MRQVVGLQNYFKYKEKQSFVNCGEWHVIDYVRSLNWQDQEDS